MQAHISCLLKTTLKLALLLPWCPWNASVEMYNFLIGCHPPRRKCVGPIVLSGLWNAFKSHLLTWNYLILIWSKCINNVLSNKWYFFAGGYKPCCCWKGKCAGWQRRPNVSKTFNRVNRFFPPNSTFSINVQLNRITSMIGCFVFNKLNTLLILVFTHVLCWVLTLYAQYFVTTLCFAFMAFYSFPHSGCDIAGTLQQGCFFFQGGYDVICLLMCKSVSLYCTKCFHILMRGDCIGNRPFPCNM